MTDITKTRIRRTEKKIRKGMYVFASFACLYSGLLILLPNIKEMKTAFFIAILLLLLLAFPLTKAVRRQLFSLRRESEWDKKKQLQDYKKTIHIIKLIAVFSFYLFLQIGVSVTLYPQIEQIKWNDVPLYIPFFVANSYLFSLFYSKYIFNK